MWDSFHIICNISYTEWWFSYLRILYFNRSVLRTALPITKLKYRPSYLHNIRVILYRGTPYHYFCTWQNYYKFIPTPIVPAKVKFQIISKYTPNATDSYIHCVQWCYRMEVITVFVLRWLIIYLLAYSFMQIIINYEHFIRTLTEKIYLLRVRFYKNVFNFFYFKQKNV